LSFDELLFVNDVVQLVLGNCDASIMLIDKNAGKIYLHILKFLFIFLVLHEYKSHVKTYWAII
jgi:hypothetical protein